MQLLAWSKRLGMDDRFQDRYLDEGFSGSEKKRNEVLRWPCSNPMSPCSTRPIPASTSARFVTSPPASRRCARTGRAGILLITHYQRILDHLAPDVVHVLVDGRVVESGGPELSATVEAIGFETFREQVA